MIYTVEDNRYLKYSTPLIEYIKSKHLYNNQNLIYTKKYSNGSFSITNPTEIFTNCDFINGYPHFNIPLDKCIEEIEFFLSDQSMYSNTFYLRYGDTHPHKCIPKLAQVRNLIIEDLLSNMIGENAKSFYVLGDISIKSLNDFIQRKSINCSSEELFVKIVNNKVSSDVFFKLEEYDLDALSKIFAFLKEIQLKPKEFLTESKLYENQKLYRFIKNNPNYFEELKDNGELKYSLQELMFINSIIKEDSDVLINIIGANQTSHVLKVEELLKENFNIRSRFLTYEICRNADERNVEIWSNKLIDFIEKNDIKIDGEFISYQKLLRILMTINSNDVIIDYNNLSKYKSNIIKFNSIVSSIDKLSNNYSIFTENDLICKMALVCYNLNRTIEMGNQINFYKYILSIVNEYENNSENYKNIEGLYKMFLIKCFDRMGFIKNEKVKELKR